MQSFQRLRVLFVSLVLLALPGAASANQEGRNSEFEALPCEMIEAVMDHLSPQELANLMASKKVFFEIGKNHPIWKSACIKMGENVAERLHTDMYFFSRRSRESFKSSIKKIQDTSLADISDLSWRDLFIFILKLKCNSKSFREIEKDSLPDTGVLNTMSCTLKNGAMLTSIGVPGLLVAGGCFQAVGVASVLLSMPVSLISPMASTGPFLYGSFLITAGTALEVAVCMVPAASLVYGYRIQNEETNEEIDIARREFRSNVWAEIKNKFEGLEIPEILLVFSWIEE
jgi:hypothetical protein